MDDLKNLRMQQLFRDICPVNEKNKTHLLKTNGCTAKVIRVVPDEEHDNVVLMNQDNSGYGLFTMRFEKGSGLHRDAMVYNNEGKICIL